MEFMMIAIVIFSFISVKSVIAGPTLLSGDPDKNKLTPQIMASRGFIDEFHSIFTPDGYQIGLHRIIHPYKAVTRYPVLMAIEDAGSSVEWLRCDAGGSVNESLNFVGPNLGFEIAKRGYDVWLLDARGIYPYSSNHTKYNIDHDLEYWDYSQDDIAFFDIPTAIDYVRDMTGRYKIGLVTIQTSGFSYFVLSSRVPRFNHIIEPLIALVPIFSLSNSQVDSSTFAAEIEEFKIQRGQLYPQGLQAIFATSICNNGIMQMICNQLINLILPSQFPNGHVGSTNVDRLSVYIGTGTNDVLSRWQRAQIMSLSLSDHVTMFNINPEINIRRYGTIVPPEYFPEKVTNPEMHFISATYDNIHDYTDVQILKLRLGVKLKSEVVIPIEFSTMSYLDGRPEDVIQWVNTPVLNILSSYN